jgi:hypothetical protein
VNQARSSSAVTRWCSIVVVAAGAAASFAAVAKPTAASPSVRQARGDAVDRKIVKIGSEVAKIVRREPNLAGSQAVLKTQRRGAHLSSRELRLFSSELYLEARDDVSSRRWRGSPEEIRSTLVRPPLVGAARKNAIEKVVGQGRARLRHDVNFQHLMSRRWGGELHCVDEFRNGIYSLGVCLRLIERGIFFVN